MLNLGLTNHFLASDHKKAGGVDYRRLYERHLGYVLEKGVHVHHIDHNRLNNSISNLVAIPASLHAEYHFRHTLINQARKPKRPSKARLEKYSPINLPANLSMNEQMIFLLNCDLVRHEQADWEAYQASEAKYQKCLNTIKSIKKSQR